MNEKEKNEAQKEKIGIGAWISLVILILVLSGAFRTVDGPLKVLDSSARAAPARRTASWPALT